MFRSHTFLTPLEVVCHHCFWFHHMHHWMGSFLLCPVIWFRRGHLLDSCYVMCGMWWYGARGCWFWFWRFLNALYLNFDPCGVDGTCSVPMHPSRCGLGLRWRWWRWWCIENEVHYLLLKPWFFIAGNLVAIIIYCGFCC